MRKVRKTKNNSIWAEEFHLASFSSFLLLAEELGESCKDGTSGACGCLFLFRLGSRVIYPFRHQADITPRYLGEVVIFSQEGDVGAYVSLFTSCRDLVERNSRSADYFAADNSELFNRYF